jgi:hypothetical protein
MKIWYKACVALIAFVLIILIEIPFYRTPSKVIPPDAIPDLSNGWRFVISLLLKGGGNPPNLLVIAIYLACFKQKHRAALHVLLYQC